MVTGDMSPGRRHYERRVSQARATRKPVTRNAIEVSTGLELSGGLIVREDMADEDLLVVVQRDGSSNRTVEELLNVFLDDVIGLALEDNMPDIASRLEDLRSTDPDDLDWLAYKAETLLWQLGYGVDWEDGYMIYREV
jgi:hypothetical protein